METISGSKQYRPTFIGKTTIKYKKVAKDSFNNYIRDQ